MALSNSINNAFIYPAITDSTTARTLSFGDINSVISFTNTSGATVTIPLNATVALPIGFQVTCRCSSGNTNILILNPEAGVTFQTYTPFIGNRGFVTLQKITTNAWLIVQAYERLSHSTTFSWGGFTTPSQIIDVKHINGQVFVSFPYMSFTSTQTSFLQSNTALPTRFTPSNNAGAHGSVSLDGAVSQIAGRYVENSSGTLFVTSATGTGTFAAAPSITCEGITISFSI